MKKRSNLEKQLQSALKGTPKLSDVAPDLKIPDFKSDAEEVAWLDRNHERLAALTEKHGAKIQLALKEPTQQISIRLPVRDIERARKIAVRNKENYQAVIKRAVRNGLAQV